MPGVALGYRHAHVVNASAYAFDPMWISVSLDEHSLSGDPRFDCEAVKYGIPAISVEATPFALRRSELTPANMAKRYILR